MTTETAPKTYTTFKEFWPFYLGEHSHPVNRMLHFIGTSFALGWILTAIINLNPFYIFAALFSGYFFCLDWSFFCREKPSGYFYLSAEILYGRLGNVFLYSYWANWKGTGKN
ncbi:PF06127 family protein [Leptospira interrogans serovar Canicola]|nr:PF06127 family protein [Leptospira interrogans serovar Canicola]